MPRPDPSTVVRTRPPRTLRKAVVEPGPELHGLAELKPALDGCRRCPLYRDATQGVAGEGPGRAPIMLVGEQPGNDEDLAGQPFVGPAGRILDKALSEAGIDRKTVYVTNAVKHFKHEPRGKKRLHKRPNPDEIKRCRWWLEQEFALVKPKLVVAMGATAAASVLQRAVTIGKERGRLIDYGDAHALVTIHPSFLLRIRERDDWDATYRDFVNDLRIARKHLAH
jgi:uracil-DNA glycosylase